MPSGESGESSSLAEVLVKPPSPTLARKQLLQTLHQLWKVLEAANGGVLGESGWPFPRMARDRMG
jgi:hypothetical protein